MLLFEYPKCSTCQKAKKYLESKNFNYKSRNIVIDKLNVYELDRLIQKSGKDINKFFNTSGLKYKELKLKDKIKTNEAITNEESEKRAISSQNVQDAIDALQVLGYNRKSIQKAFEKIVSNDKSVEELIKEGLKELAN